MAVLYKNLSKFYKHIKKPSCGKENCVHLEDNVAQASAITLVFKSSMTDLIIHFVLWPHLALLKATPT